MGYILDLCLNKLITADFDGTNCVGFYDKAFGSTRLLQETAARGIGGVAMTRGGRPKAPASGKTWADYFPFRKYIKEERDEARRPPPPGLRASRR